jgi:NADP-dependent aldehyde dehydrogenase
MHHVDALSKVPGVRAITGGWFIYEPGYRVPAILLSVDAADLVTHADTLLEEAFGPAALVVEYESDVDLERALDAVPGSLTATLHADAATETEHARRLFASMAARAGRVIWDGWPTGVAVTWAQHHGGPWPATTASVHTSVGVTAMRRFLRPVVYQNVPDELLPAALRDSNPLGLPRRINPSGEPR